MVVVAVVVGGGGTFSAGEVGKDLDCWRKGGPGGYFELYLNINKTWQHHISPPHPPPHAWGEKVPVSLSAVVKTICTLFV